MVKVVKKQGFDTPVPEVIATLPGRQHDADLQHHDLQGLRRDAHRIVRALAESW